MFVIESCGNLRPRADEYARESEEISAASVWAPDSVLVMTIYKLLLCEVQKWNEHICIARH